MRYPRYFALLSILMLPLVYSQAQVGIGIGIGVGPGYYDGPPDCPYGYYGYYPYACAPYGYYGPQWFDGGLFIVPAPGGAAVDTVTGAAVTVGAAAVTVTDEAATDAAAGVADVAAMDAVVTDAVAMDTPMPEAVEVVSMVEAAASTAVVDSMVAADTAEAASMVAADTAEAATAVDTVRDSRQESVSTAGSTALPAVFLWLSGRNPPAGQDKRRI